ncbi:MAG: ABC transporter permease [Clostridiales Family XIII bacterium]|jgi:putative ABC transport system permease protein|nr:ABC transporter permease [Clostridiales Family XIII bacterium]
MNIVENIRLAFSSLFANKMRAILTMLGIIIGIGSVIGIMTMGNSLSGYMSSSMQDLGTNNVTVYLQEKSEEEERAGDAYDQMRSFESAEAEVAQTDISEKDLISDEMLDIVRSEFKDIVEYISVTDTVGSGSVSDGDKYANLSLLGVSADYAKASSLEMKSGRFLSEKDASGNKKVAVVSEKLTEKMFGSDDPLGKQIFIDTDVHSGVYTIVGVYWYKEDMMNVGAQSSEKNLSTNVFIPLSIANMITGNSGSQSVTIVTKAGSDSIAFASDVKNYFNEVFYSKNQDYQITALSMEDMMQTMMDMMATMEIAIAAIAAISLLVGGIGVMNIMLVSITERTREIGTRKALGATNGEIRVQFIIEAVIICLVGGLIGIGVGVLIGAVGASLLNFPAVPSLFAILLATGFSTFIGLFFGYYPANKAAKMDPIDALRYE